MYQVNIGDKVLYYPTSKDYAIYNTELNEEIGLAGEFTFKVPPTNPLYDQLTQGALITILDNNAEIWRGEIKDIKIDFAKIADVYCVEDLGMLGYEFAPPESTKTETYAQRFQAAIAYYNANRPAELQFTAGYITNVTDSNLCNWTTEHEWSILDSIRACICRDTGYLRVRRVTSGGTVTRYIDVVRLEDYGRVNQQPIEYGYNLLDYVKESDYGNLVNVLTPYGAEVDTEVYEGYNERVQGDTITNAASVSVYGRHAKAVVFDNVTDVNSLNALASSYLTRYSQPQLKMEVKAVDLSQVENVDEIKIGDSLHIIAKPFAVDQWLYLTQIKRDLQNAGNNTITLSGYVRSGQTLTSQNAETIEAIKNIPSKSNILDAAKKNALNMLLDETQGGHIVYEYHYTDGKPDYIEAMNVCDAPTIDASLSRWRWSYNGLGFMSRQSTSDPWDISDMPIALTNAGEIVADYITTGTMQANRIKGGTLTLGGSGNGNGVCSVLNAGDQEKVKLDSNGITASAGNISGFKIGIDTVTNSAELKYVYDNSHYIRLAGGSWGGGITLGDGSNHASLDAGALYTDGGVYAKRYNVDGNAGATGQISWVAGGTGYAINVKNGLVVGIAST